MTSNAAAYLDTDAVARWLTDNLDGFQARSRLRNSQAGKATRPFA
jgi:phosphatidylglycerophosphate synthase